MNPPYPFGKGPLARALEIYLSDVGRAKTLKKEIEGLTTFPKTLDTLHTRLRDFDFVKRLDEYDRKQKAAAKKAGKAGSGRRLGETEVDHLLRQSLGTGRLKKPKSEDVDKALLRARVQIDGLCNCIDVAMNRAGDGAIWPIEIFWGCGANEPEVWISWSRDPGSPVGRVTAIFLSERQQTQVSTNGLTKQKERSLATKAARGMYVQRSGGFKNKRAQSALFRANVDRGMPGGRLEEIFGRN